VRAAAAALVLCLAFQEDPARWIEKLGNEAIEEREEATRRLQELGPAGLPRLEKAQEEARDPEVKARLASIVATIKKRAELAKAFGPTKRVTLAAKGRKVSELLQEIRIAGTPPVGTGDLDPDATVDLNLTNATWWEALDGIAKAAGARVALERQNSRVTAPKLVTGRGPAFPAMYVEQFRVSVVEVKRHELRRPGGTEDIAMIVVEVSYQPDLKPARQTFGKSIVLQSVRDAKGNDVLVERPRWLGGTKLNARELSVQKAAWIRADAEAPITVEGTTDLLFQAEAKETTIDLKEGGEGLKLGEATVKVVSFRPSKGGAVLKLTAEAKGEADLAERFIDRTISIEDAEGKAHMGSCDSRCESRSEGGGTIDVKAEWEFRFPSEIKDPRKAKFRWVSEFHRVQIPFRLEGVRLP